jgi:predicted nucleic acid-binding protein
VIVLDAPVLAAVVGDDGDDGARCRALLRAGREAALPDFADLEAAAVLRKRWLGRGLSDTRLLEALSALAALPFPRFPARDFLHRAYELKANVSPYGAAYIALAEALGAELVTADRRLASAPGIRCRVQVVPPLAG